MSKLKYRWCVCRLWSGISHNPCSVSDVPHVLKSSFRIAFIQDILTFSVLWEGGVTGLK